MAGKHDKEIVMNWDEGSGENYTAAEISRLRSENKELKSRINELEEKYAKAVKAYYKLKGYAEDLVKSKDRTIEKKERKILALVDDYV